MKKKIKHYLKEIVLFLIVMTLLANAISFYRSMDLNKEPLSALDLKLIDGSEYSLERSKPLLVHLWAIWCPTCKVEAANIQRISQHYEVLTIAVKSGSNQELQNYMQENGYTFRVLNDSDGYYAKTFGISAYPSTLIYDKEQKVRFSEVGYTSTLGLWLRMWWVK
ncbi:protein disulfide oxidoreductase [Sulfurimonas sp.]|uniref:protein disulfide oxidoreductase n=1 Tax=Sulfurimonas sp. TaxID=2022749 RepID=UPI0019D8F246|nr:protein disulfide oxidoreductase [Sulfurimonas sp.]MBE0514526.1 protein disulfide oxidoreductase [Sulfurimonas sp.]